MVIYQLEYQTELTVPAWTPVGSPVTGTRATLTLTNRIAIFYGPLVLGGELGTGDLPASLEAPDHGRFRNVPDPEMPGLATGGQPAALWLKPVSGQSRVFRTAGVGRPYDVTLVPLYCEYSERYTVCGNLLIDAH